MSSPNDATSEMVQAAMEHDAVAANVNDSLDDQVADRHMVADVCGDNEEVVHDDAGNKAAENGQVSEHPAGNQPGVEDQVEELAGYESPTQQEIQVLEHARAEAQSADDDQESINDPGVTIRAMPNAEPICRGEYNSWFGSRYAIDSYYKWSWFLKDVTFTNVIDCQEWYDWAVDQDLPPEKLLTYDNCTRGDYVLTEAGFFDEAQHIETRGETVFAVNQLGLFMDKLTYVEEIGKFVVLKGMSLHSPASLYLHPILDEDGGSKKAPWTKEAHSMFDTYKLIKLGLEQRHGFLIQTQGECLWPAERVWIVEGESPPGRSKKRAPSGPSASSNLNRHCLQSPVRAKVRTIHHHKPLE
ncbi:hypothetical protein AAVH_18883 [Aphelenchoides avenae]|nr:hypothetical protein AAVH_18883 [Aphelenchus avenae]